MKLKKTITVIKYTVIIIFAVMGIGMVGGVPVQASNKNENTIELNIDLKNETNDEDNEILELEIKQ